MNIYSLAFLLLSQFPFLFPIMDSQQKLNRHKPAVTNIVFKSNDGGQTWQDISEGLPGNLEDGDVHQDVFFADNSGLYLSAATGLYQSTPGSMAPFWKKAVSPGKPGSIAPGKTGIYSYHYGGQILQKINGTSVWSPVYTNFKGSIRTVFETAGGTIFIGSDNGLFKSTNDGKTWKQVHAGGWVIKMVAADGVLVATSMKGILRSADDGETWALVISEGGVGIDVARIQGGFAAISFCTTSNTRRVRASYDGGKTWQPIDAGLPGRALNVAIGQPLPQVNATDSAWHPNNTGLPEQAFITSIVQVEGYFFCGHPQGIFRSSDKGRTWTLLLPSIKNKVFNLYGSGNVIYAIPINGGC